MQSITTNLTKLSKKVLKENKEIEDIILFGSFMKGKSKPKDIDILLIFKTKINKSLETPFKQLNEKIDVNSITKQELDGEGFIAKEGLYLEGLSLKTNKLLANSLGFSSFALVKYSLKNIKGSERVKFYYALNGRNKEGFLTTIQAKKFSEEVIICDYNKIEQLKDFFNTWNLKYNITPTLIPSRLKNILTIEK